MEIATSSTQELTIDRLLLCLLAALLLINLPAFFNLALPFHDTKFVFDNRASRPTDHIIILFEIIFIAVFLVYLLASVIGVPANPAGEE